MSLTRIGLKVLVVGAGLLVAACHTTKSAGDGSASGKGAPTPGSQQDLVVNVGDRVFFGYDKYDLSPEAQATLSKQAAWLAKFPSVSVTVEGHCDERGTREYNLALGDSRANSAKSYLVGLGVAASRITTISYGKERPEATCSDESCWSVNRRSVTVVTSGAAS